MAKEHCNIAAISLTQGQYAIVDIWNYEWLNQWKWCAHKRHTKHKENFYAERGQCLRRIDGKQKTKIFRMHRQIMDFPKGLQVDHINGESLINLESNLRNVTPRQNSQNRHHLRSSQYPGVGWAKREQKWRARISINGGEKHLGYRSSEKEAYKLYYKELEKINDQM
jgi:hypothetical protein